MAKYQLKKLSKRCATHRLICLESKNGDISAKVTRQILYSLTLYVGLFRKRISLQNADGRLSKEIHFTILKLRPLLTGISFTKITIQIQKELFMKGLRVKDSLLTGTILKHCTLFVVIILVGACHSPNKDKLQS